MDEMEEWYQSVERNAEVVTVLQDSLASAPEFVALVQALKQSPTGMTEQSMRDVANFAVLHITEKAKNLLTYGNL